MPKNKDLKRLIRARMEKTGESYTAARAHILRKTPQPLPDDYADLAGMSDEAVAAKTGRNWPEWVHALDGIGAAGMDHAAIARHMGDQLDSAWWAQTVTVGYERIRGLRDVGQRRGGLWEANRSRTIRVSADTVFHAIVDDATRKRWLDTDLTIRTATSPRSVRVTWPDDTRVSMDLTAKGLDKTTLQIQHSGLESPGAREERKTFWGQRLDALKTLLEEGA